MSELMILWSEIYINQKAETEIVKLIIQKMEKAKEMTLQKVTHTIIKTFEDGYHKPHRITPFIGPIPSTPASQVDDYSLSLTNKLQDSSRL